MSVDNQTNREAIEAEQHNQPIDVVRMKRKATKMFHENHDDGDLAIYGLVSEMLEWHTAALAQAEARGRVDELKRLSVIAREDPNYQVPRSQLLDRIAELEASLKEMEGQDG